MLWVPDTTDVWVPARLVGEDEKGNLKASVITTGKLLDLKKSTCIPIADPELLKDAPDDLISLAEVHEASILNAIRVKFLEKCIYTSCGTVLMVVNPFTKIENLYGPEKVILYRNPYAEGLVPHVFKTASTAYYQMCTFGKNQSILIRY